MRQQPENIEDKTHAKDSDGVNSRWLSKVRSSWDSSTSYYESNYQEQQVKNQCYFDNTHPPGSKYNKPAYAYRSKLFRPKIRSASRNLEAAGTQAFFSTIDPIDIKAENESLEKDVNAALLTGGLLKHHLTNTMNWFQTCIGGLQDAYKTGVVCSYNHWVKKVETKKTKKVQYSQDGEALRDESGEFVYREEIEEKVVEDRPNVELYPINHLRYHPNAHWIDPLNSSPYVALIRPMYVYEIKGRMSGDQPIYKKWKSYTDAEIIAAKLSMSNDQAAQQRRKQTQDPIETQTEGVEDYDVSIVLQWFMMGNDGVRYTFYTLGTDLMLTDPVPVKKEFSHGKVPITMGYTILESHRNFPTAAPELAEGLQKEANDIANSRLDNVKLVLNKRFIGKRGAQLDVKSLVLNAAGSVTLTNDPINDVRELEFNDVTGSSFAEQDRINNDTDELLGNFSQGSVQTNRKMNETVGGMSMMRGAAGQMTDYTLKTFVETWMEPTLRQVASLIQNYETDESRYSLVGSQLGMEDKDPNEKMVKGGVRITVNVGVGAGNPVFKAEQFISTVKQFADIIALGLPGMKVQEIAKELFGYIGYKDGSKFFELDEEGNLNPKVAELQKEVDELSKKLQGNVEAKRIEVEGRREIQRMVTQQKAESERKDRELQEANNKRDNQTRLKEAMFKWKFEAKKINAEIRKIDSAEKIAAMNSDTQKETAKISSQNKPSAPAKQEAKAESKKQKSLASFKIVKSNGKTKEIIPEFKEGAQSKIKIEYEETKAKEG